MIGIVLVSHSAALAEGLADLVGQISGEDVRVAIFSTLRPGTYPVYPDSDKVGANRRYFRMQDAVDYWDGEGRS